MEIIGTIDDKYLIIEKKGFGATSILFQVRDKTTGKIYATKVLLSNQKLFKNEIQILEELKALNNPNIINMIDSGHGKIIRKNKPDRELDYITLEYAPKGSLFKYIFYSQNGLEEKLGKILFYKILKGIKSIHDVGICHRDLKLENILVDENYTPKLCDFGFATYNTSQLTDFLGTPIYTAPEIHGFKKYDGLKADIFSLGVVLFYLITGKVGFKTATNKDPLYRLIIIKHYSYYWKLVHNEIKPLSEELKNLYIKMISYNPKERPSVDEILNDNWLKEIRELNEEEYFELEDKMREELASKEVFMRAHLQKKIKYEEFNKFNGLREIEDTKIFFNNVKELNYAISCGMEQYIKIDGELEPTKEMNHIANLIDKELNKTKETCVVSADKNVLKFNVRFLNVDEDSDYGSLPKEYLEELKKYDECFKEDDNIKKNECVIQVKLFLSSNGGYLLRFVKKSGEIGDYYNNLNKILNLMN